MTGQDATVAALDGDPQLELDRLEEECLARIMAADANPASRRAALRRHVLKAGLGWLRSAPEGEAAEDFSRASLAALHRRNQLTLVTNQHLAALADAASHVGRAIGDITEVK